MITLSILTETKNFKGLCFFQSIELTLKHHPLVICKLKNISIVNTFLKKQNADEYIPKRIPGQIVISLVVVVIDLSPSEQTTENSYVHMVDLQTSVLNNSRLVSQLINA